MALLQPDILPPPACGALRRNGMCVIFISLMLAACEQGELAVTDSGQWGTVKSTDAIAACTMTALGTDATVHTITPNQALEIRSNAQRAGSPMYIITVTRVDSGLTMVQLRAYDEKASRRAKAAVEPCIS